MTIQDELNEMVRKAVEKYNSLSPDEREKHRKEQARGWVTAELMLEHPELTREQVEKLVDYEPPIKLPE